LDQYVIMPNHIHGILNIHKRTGASPDPDMERPLSNVILSFFSLFFLTLDSVGCFDNESV